MAEAWAAVLNGVLLAGGDTSATGGENAGCLTSPPDGMGNPPIRTEDVTFPQRDGVEHFADWYDPRIITLADVSVCAPGCPSCPTTRQQVRAISNAWSRHCDDTELVIFTDCHDPSPSVTGADRALIGPYGAVGRPRVASTQWTGMGTKCATMLLRFDAVDHRLFILDAAGTPGSGEQCLALTPAVESTCRTYPRCYDTVCSPGVSGMAYTVDSSTPGTGPEPTDNFGDLCAPLTITLTGTLTNPTIINETTGEELLYNGVIGPDDADVIINTQTGTATQDGQPRTWLLEGDVFMHMALGENIIRMTSLGPTDDGNAQVCFRPAVVQG